MRAAHVSGSGARGSAALLGGARPLPALRGCREMQNPVRAAMPRHSCVRSDARLCLPLDRRSWCVAVVAAPRSTATVRLSAQGCWVSLPCSHSYTAGSGVRAVGRQAASRRWQGLHAPVHPRPREAPFQTTAQTGQQVPPARSQAGKIGLRLLSLIWAHRLLPSTSGALTRGATSTSTFVGIVTQHPSCTALGPVALAGAQRLEASKHTATDAV